MTMEFNHYDVVPKNVADDIIASRKQIAQACYV